VKEASTRGSTGGSSLARRSYGTDLADSYRQLARYMPESSMMRDRRSAGAPSHETWTGNHCQNPQGAAFDDSNRRGHRM